MQLSGPEQLLRMIDRAANTLGLDLRLDANALVDAALQRANRPAFRDLSFVPALRHLLDACHREAALGLFGRHAARWDVLRCLTNLLRFEAEEEQRPEILREQISRPIFITGLPRSGTTLLHALLALDPSLNVPRCWQTIAPYPRKEKDRRRRTVERQLRAFQRVAPEMATLHPMKADSPQECTEITAQVFQSLRYEMTYRVPSYQVWIDSTGHLNAYLFHKRFLQHLQWQQGARRWALKCPDHIHALNAIETVYPDCGLVFVHRDPLRVIASAAKLTEVVRRPFTMRVDKAEIGCQVMARLIEGADTMIERSKRSHAGRVFHVHYAEFARNPLTTIHALYRHFGMKLSPMAREHMCAHLAAVAPTRNRYSTEEFGLDAEQLRRRFEHYLEQFGIQRESEFWDARRTASVQIAA